MNGIRALLTTCNHAVITLVGMALFAVIAVLSVAGRDVLAPMLLLAILLVVFPLCFASGSAGVPST
jgi:hypothetical protein